MTVCIQYSRPQSGSKDTEIFGHDVAVTNFLLAYFRYSQAQQFVCRPSDMPSFEHFKSMASLAGHKAEGKCVGLDPRHPQQNLQGISCLFRADPLTTDLMWRRQQMTGRGYATCGLVHTMSGERISQAVADMCVAPSDASDALICPSQSIRTAVLNLWENYSEYLNFRFGGKFTCPIQTPVIPLGIDTGKFEKLTTPEQRAQQRAALRLADDEVAILFVGRLSFATKAHPLPLFMAAERAAQMTGMKLRLLVYGYFLPADMEPHFRALAADLCPTVKVEFIMNNDPRFPDGLWAAGDIFTSLSDNVQESFGLTPIEAMACGLPAVVTDWDGYREGVRDGLDGFRIQTFTPPMEAGLEIAQHYYNENNYGVALTGTSQSTAIDIHHCAQAFSLLASSPEKRKEMGESGKLRARVVFDWKNIIPAYEALWNELAEKRAANTHPRAIPEGWQAAHPAYVNPWKMFGDFPTRHLRPRDVMRIAMSETDVEVILKHEMNYFVPGLLLPKESMRQLISVIRQAEAARIEDILIPFPVDQKPRLLRCLGWMLKHGVCVLDHGAL